MEQAAALSDQQRGAMLQESLSTAINDSSSYTIRPDVRSPYFTDFTEEEWQYIKSYRGYVYCNGLRFVVIAVLIILIAMMRQLRLMEHYNLSQCCFCYYTASQSNYTHISFEWSTCQFMPFEFKHGSHKNINHPNEDCGYVKKIEKTPDNLSFNLIKMPWFYAMTAGVVFIICVCYAMLTCKISISSLNIGVLLRKLSLERIILYNVIISILCFYQIIIDYQFHKEDFNDVEVEMDVKQPSNKKCYVNSLNNVEKLVMEYSTIAAFIYIAVPFVKQLIIHCCCKDNIDIVTVVTKIFDGIVCGCCGFVIIGFLGILILYSYLVVFTHKFIWFNYPAVVLVDILLLMSLFDVVFIGRTIVKYRQNPYITICKYLLCQCYCNKKHDDEIRSIREYFGSPLMNE